MKGVVVKFDAERGFGFIRPKGRADVFVHIGDVRGQNRLRAGQSVDFTLRTTPKGDRAVKVRPRRAKGLPTARFLRTAALSALLVGLGVSSGLGFSPFWAYLLGVNAGTFVLYAYDKSASSRAQLRVPEKVLHLLGLLGGTPAAFAGQYLLRHKTRKPAFQVWLVLSVALQVGFYMLYKRLLGEA